MKKTIKALASFALVLGLAGCSASGTAASTKGSASAEDKTIKVGATAVPHAEILNDVVKPALEKEGWTLDVVEFNDYVQPNTALNDGDLDANYFQTVRYLDEQIKERSLKLTAVAGIHLEPMGLYSSKYKSLDEIPDGSRIAIPNDGSNESRALKLLEDNGLITLDHSKDLYVPGDVTENKKNLQFDEVDAATLPRTLDDDAASVINGNYALQANLNPKTDALCAEAADGPDAHYYINYLVVQEGNEDTEKTKALVKALQSDDVKKYIEDKYQGSVIPAFTDGDGNVLK